MTNVLKQTIISIIPLYISKECPAFNKLIKAIGDIQDDKFDQVINQQSSSINQCMIDRKSEFEIWSLQIFSFQRTSSSQLELLRFRMCK
jgi:hypothetical protein